MAGVDYRQLQAPAQVDTSLPDSGAAARAAALGQAFKEFEGLSSDYGTKVVTQAGALAGAAAGATGHPDYKTGLLRFTAYSRAFNNAATGAYVAQAEAAADDAAARLRVEANKDPELFATAYAARRDAVLKEAPALARPELMQMYNKRLAAGRAAVAGEQAEELQVTHRQAYDESIARQTSRVAILQGSDNPHDQLEAMDEHAKLSAQIDGGVNSGLYSKAEAEAMHIGAMRTITAQVFSTQVDRELARPDGDVIHLLENFRAAHVANLADPNAPPTLSEPEFQKLMQDATTKIREQNMLVAMNKREGKSAEQLKFEAGDRLYTYKVLTGHATASELAQAQLTGDLKPERATGLSQLLAQGAVLKSDPRAYLAVHNDPASLDLTPDQIAALPGISNADKIKLGTELEKRRNSWEGTQQSKQAVGTIAAALKILPGTPVAAMSETQRKAYTDAHQEYLGLVNAMKPSDQQSQASLNAAAQTAITHAQQRAASAEADALERAKQSQIKNHGPGTADSWDTDKLQKYIDDKDKQIAAARARAKGQ